MTKSEVLLLLLFALFALWAGLSRVAGLLESLLKAQMSMWESERDRQRATEKLADERVRESQERERRINACPLCYGERLYYGRACVYCLGYGEARRSEEADRRFKEWASEVRQKWTARFGMPY
jgi:hypothetical protein